MSGRHILLGIRQPGVLRHYADVIEVLRAGGHRISVCVDHPDKGGQEWRVTAFGEQPDDGLDVRPGIRGPLRLQRDLTERLRSLCDVLLYTHSDFDDAGWLRARAFSEAEPGVRRWAERLGRSRRVARAAMRAALALDRILPPPLPYGRLLDELSPDLVLAAPVVWRGSLQVDLLKAASRRRIPTAILVPSWDNLTTKGLMRYVPDTVFVWNEFQRDELVRLHDIPPDRVSCTGAPTFDRWFSDPAVVGRAEFSRRVGLDPARPFILYLGSSRQVAPGETLFFERWLDVLRSAGDPRLRDVQVLVRPHPTPATHSTWLAENLDDQLGVVVWPSNLAEALASTDYEEDYAASLRYCAAAVGLNTSAMIEAAIFGRPVCTWRDGDLGRRQLETLHYRHLLAAGGGLLHVAECEADHLRDLVQALEAEVEGRSDARAAAFVAAFVRPRGVDRPVAPRLAAEFVALAENPTTALPPGRLARGIGQLVARCAFLVGLPLRDRPFQVLFARIAALFVLGWAEAISSPITVKRLARAASGRMRRLVRV